MQLCIKAAIHREKNRKKTDFSVLFGSVLFRFSKTEISVFAHPYPTVDIWNTCIKELRNWRNMNVIKINFITRFPRITTKHASEISTVEKTGIGDKSSIEETRRSKTTDELNFAALYPLESSR
jgi:hypothetical protein